MAEDAERQDIAVSVRFVDECDYKEIFYQNSQVDFVGTKIALPGVT